MYKIVSFLFVLLLSESAYSQSGYYYPQDTTNSDTNKSVYFKLRDTIYGKIILEEDPQFDCGVHMPQSSDLFIIETSNHTMIRVIDIVVSSFEYYAKGNIVKIIPAAYPKCEVYMPDTGPIHISKPIHPNRQKKKQWKEYNKDLAEFNKYDTKFVKTTFGHVCPK